jgi:hypothetical protein
MVAMSHGSWIGYEELEAYVNRYWRRSRVISELTPPQFVCALIACEGYSVNPVTARVKDVDIYLHAWNVLDSFARKKLIDGKGKMVGVVRLIGPRCAIGFESQFSSNSVQFQHES